MIGNRSPRYARFGWAAARFDDAANFVAGPRDGAAGGGVRAAGGRIARRGAARVAPRRGPPPQPQRGCGGGGVRRCAGRAARRADAVRTRTGDPADARRRAAPEVADLARAVRLSRAVQAAAAVVAVCLSAAGRSGRRASPRSVSGAPARVRLRRPSPVGAAESRRTRSSPTDRGDDAERDPLDAVRQEWAGIEVGQGDDAETAGLILDELQIRAGQRHAGDGRDLRGVDRVHLLRAVLAERILALRDRFGVAQPRGDRHRSGRRRRESSAPASLGRVARIRGRPTPRGRRRRRTAPAPRTRGRRRRPGAGPAPARRAGSARSP